MLMRENFVLSCHLTYIGVWEQIFRGGGGEGVWHIILCYLNTNFFPI